MSSPVSCYIAFGSNLENPAAQVSAALEHIAQLPGTRLIKTSASYRSTAIGPGDQPDYINGVAQIETTLSPQRLLTELQAIESGQGRRRRERWAARTIDLDILLYGEHCVNEADLKIPHPRMHDRNFVLLPLAELAPDLQLPDGTMLATLLDSVSGDGLWRLPTTPATDDNRATG